MTKSKSSEYLDDSEFTVCIGDLLGSAIVQSMDDFTQHSDLSCLDHCINVAYSSYRLCRSFGLDYRAAARGALLHDLFLYDWHTAKPEKGERLHGFTHAKAALDNANKHFTLSELEKNIIERHMWPLNITPPRYRESFIVSFADKYCTVLEVAQFQSRLNALKQMLKLAMPRQ